MRPGSPMPNVDLTTLNGPELRQLLDTTRNRGQAEQSYLILQEMAARRERDGRERARAGARGEPRFVELTLGDPRAPGKDEGTELPAFDPGAAKRAPLKPLPRGRPRAPAPPPQRHRLLGAGFAI